MTKPLPRIVRWLGDEYMAPGYIAEWPMPDPVTQKSWWWFAHAAQAVEQVMAWFRHCAKEDRAA